MTFKFDVSYIFLVFFFNLFVSPLLILMPLHLSSFPSFFHYSHFPFFCISEYSQCLSDMSCFLGVWVYKHLRRQLFVTVFSFVALNKRTVSGLSLKSCSSFTTAFITVSVKLIHLYIGSNLDLQQLRDSEHSFVHCFRI